MRSFFLLIAVIVSGIALAVLVLAGLASISMANRCEMGGYGRLRRAGGAATNTVAC